MMKTGISSQQSLLFFVWAGPGPDSRDGPKPVWPTNTRLGQNQSGPEKEKPTMPGQNQPGPAT